jgi:hypothetical protein
VDGIQFEVEEEMPYRRAFLAQRRCVPSPTFFRHVESITLLAMEDYLQERLNRETSEPGFSDLPFRFAEISKVLLDVYAFQLPSSPAR